MVHNIQAYKAQDDCCSVYTDIVRYMDIEFWHHTNTAIRQNNFITELKDNNVPYDIFKYEVGMQGVKEIPLIWTRDFLGTP